MRYTRPLLLIASTLYLNACVTTVDPRDASAVAQNIYVQNDPYTMTRKISGPVVKDTGIPHFFIAEKKGSKKMLAIMAEYTGWEWRHLSTAFYKGNELPVKRIKQSVGACSRLNCMNTEQVVIQIPNNLINTVRNDKNFSTQLVGNGGTAYTFTPSPYLDAFFEKYDQL